MTNATTPPTWDHIEALLDELLDLNEETRSERLSELDREAPDHAKAARRVLQHALDDSKFDTGVGGVAGALLGDLIATEAQGEIGETLSVYRLDEIIGRGGMGIVYRASRIDGEFDQSVAIKRLPFGLTGERGQNRFNDERSILATIRHPYIAQLLDGGVDDEGLPFLVMELVDDGVRIDHALDQGRASQADRLNAFKKVCDATAYLHQNLVTHGDIKPANILVRPDGHPKLIDFGISRLANVDLTAREVRLTGATPGFSAPEQLAGGPIGTRSDIYALGATLRVILGAPPLASDLQAIIDKATAHDPADRYQAVESLSADINAFETGYPISTRASNVGYKVSKYARRNWLPLLSTSAVASALIAGTVISLHQARIAKAEATRAEAVSTFLTDMLIQSTNTLSSDEEPTLRSVIEAADAKITSDLDDAPAVKADIQEILGQAYDGLMLDNEKAEQHFADVLAYDRANDPENEARILSMLSWIASMKWKRGDYQGADVVIDEAIALDLKDGKPDMTGWMTKAFIEGKIGTPEGRHAALDQAEIFYAREYGRDSTEFAAVLSVRAATYSAAGDTERAEPLFKEAISMREEHGGGTWATTLRMRNNLAVLYHERGEYDRATALLETNIKANTQRLGEDHGELVGALNNLGALYMQLGQIEQAERHLSHCARNARAEMPDSSFIRIACELNYMRLKLYTGEAATATLILEDLERRATDAVGADNALSLVIVRDRAWAALDMGDVAKARGLIDRARVGLSAPSHIALAARIDGEISLVEGRNDAAIVAFAEALEAYEEDPSQQPWMQAYVRQLSAGAKRASGGAVDETQSRADRALLKDTLPKNHRAYPSE
ncbi:MAG: protein kinase domain-containing protein [Hyphomonas sp.]